MNRTLIRFTIPMWLMAFGFGLYYSIVVVWYYQSITAEEALRAGVIDLLLAVLAIGSLQAWESSGRKFHVLVSEAIGMALGSYLAVRFR